MTGIRPEHLSEHADAGESFTGEVSMIEHLSRLVAMVIASRKSARRLTYRR